MVPSAGAPILIALRRPAAALALLIGALLPADLLAQEDGPLRIRVRSQTGALEVEIGTLIDDELRSALEEGFPIRMQLRVTLWKDGFFDDRVTSYDWRATARREGAQGAYRLEVEPGNESQRTEDFSGLADALRRELPVPMGPEAPGRYYYQLALRVESLSADDLDELERWLRGDPEEVSATEERGALSRGVQRLFVRALGLPSRSLELRSRAFDWRGGPTG